MQEPAHTAQEDFEIAPGTYFPSFALISKRQVMLTCNLS